MQTRMIIHIFVLLLESYIQKKKNSDNGVQNILKNL